MAYQRRSWDLPKLRSAMQQPCAGRHSAYFKTLTVLMGFGNIVFRFLSRRCLGPSHYNPNHVSAITPCSWTIRHWFSYMRHRSHMCNAYRVIPFCRSLFRLPNVPTTHNDLIWPCLDSIKILQWLMQSKPSHSFFNSHYNIATYLIPHFPHVVLSEVFDASASEEWFVV